MKQGGTDVITTIYFGEGPPDKYQTTGVIDSTYAGAAFFTVGDGLITNVRSSAILTACAGS